MIRKQLLAFVVLGLAGGTALADDITMDDSVFTSQRWRAEVAAEACDALVAGQIPFGEAGLASIRPAPIASALTREQMQAELRSAAGRAARAQFLASYPA